MFRFRSSDLDELAVATVNFSRVPAVAGVATAADHLLDVARETVQPLSVSLRNRGPG